MGKLIIINGSPRAKKSNSRKYAEVFKLHYEGEILEYDVISKKHKSLCVTRRQPYHPYRQL